LLCHIRCISLVIILRIVVLRKGYLSSPNLWTDGKSIFDWWGTKISTDAANFVAFSPTGWGFIYAKDSQQIYLSSLQSDQITPLENIDAETFLVLNDWYAKDKNRIFFKAITEGNGTEFITSLQGADVATFVLIANQMGYDAADKDHRYYQGYIVD
jgi:hypothetical protein